MTGTVEQVGTDTCNQEKIGHASHKPEWIYFGHFDAIKTSLPAVRVAVNSDIKLFGAVNRRQERIMKPESLCGLFGITCL